MLRICFVRVLYTNFIKLCSYPVSPIPAFCLSHACDYYAPGIFAGHECKVRLLLGFICWVACLVTDGWDTSLSLSSLNACGCSSLYFILFFVIFYLFIFNIDYLFIFCLRVKRHLGSLRVETMVSTIYRRGIRRIKKYLGICNSVPRRNLLNSMLTRN